MLWSPLTRVPSVLYGWLNLYTIKHKGWGSDPMSDCIGPVEIITCVHFWTHVTIITGPSLTQTKMITLYDLENIWNKLFTCFFLHVLWHKLLGKPYLNSPIYKVRKMRSNLFSNPKKKKKKNKFNPTTLIRHLPKIPHT